MTTSYSNFFINEIFRGTSSVALHLVIRQTIASANYRQLYYPIRRNYFINNKYCINSNIV